MKFLHVADLHLGKTLKDAPDRYYDFFDAFRKVAEFAIDNHIDVILVAGDLFHKPQVSPRILSDTIDILNLLREHNIDVIATFGNHDNIGTREGSWLEFLSLRGYIKFLRPFNTEHGVELIPWDDERKIGSFIDIGNVRIYGLGYFGTQAGEIIRELLPHIDTTRENILLLHVGVNEYRTLIDVGKIDKSELIPLKDYFRYVALGHGHNNYEVDGFAYNPGGLENVNFGEEDSTKGFYVFELGKPPEFVPIDQLRKRRPMYQVFVNLTGVHLIEDVETKVLDKLTQVAPTKDALLQVTLQGRLNLHPSEIKRERLKKLINDRFTPMSTHIRVEVTTFSDTEGEELPLHQLIRDTIQTMIDESPEYRHLKDKLTDIVLKLKQLTLNETVSETEVIEELRKDSNVLKEYRDKERQIYKGDQLKLW